jgi:hypothetical protein
MDKRSTPRSRALIGPIVRNVWLVAATLLLLVVIASLVVARLPALARAGGLGLHAAFAAPKRLALAVRGL